VPRGTPARHPVTARGMCLVRLGDGGVPERTNGTASKAVRGLNRPSRVQITPPPPIRAGLRARPFPSSYLALIRMRSRRSIPLFVLVTVAVAVPRAATAALAGVPSGRYAIGDSVMLGARRALIGNGFRVNANVSRQFDDAVHLVHHLAAGGHLPVNVIVHLGTNGLIDGADCDALVRVAGGDRHVYLVTIKVPRPYRDANNRRLRACGRRHDNASVIDWYTFSRYHRAWFYDDGYHLRPVGRHEYAGLLDRSVRGRWTGRRAGRGRPLDSSRWPARAA
jgi:hypothetical protein